MHFDGLYYNHTEKALQISGNVRRPFARLSVNAQ